MLKIEFITHNGEKRIAIRFPYNPDIIKKIKSIKGSRWSASKKMWHVPDNEESLLNLKQLFPEDLAHVISHTIKKQTPPVIEKSNVHTNHTVYVFVGSKHIVLSLKKQKGDIEFIKTLNGYHWDANNLRWIVANNEENRTKIKKYFGDRLQINQYLPKTNKKQIEDKHLYVYEHIPGRIKLIFKYDSELIKLVKSLPYPVWDNKNRWWTTVYTKEVIRQLKYFCRNNNWKIEFIKKESTTTKKRISREAVPNYKECPKEYIDSLTIRRYSSNTIRTYSSMFEEFINYYHYKKPIEITEKEIIAYMRYLVVERGVSSSYQNQAINAIKYYYEQVLGEQRKFYFVERPRREKVLPEVLSKEEVEAMIKSTDNLKHKCLLMITYSGGLRLSEVKNLEVKDIDFERNIINIKKAKGKKDRITLLSKKVSLTLQEYLKIYQPRKWVFEGQVGGQYSASSMEKIVKQAAAKAGVLKKVSMHTLRHSFATHLIEKGTDIRYIQSLLGHESIKTTEIYTHITNKGLDNIKNPLDDMDF